MADLAVDWRVGTGEAEELAYIEETYGNLRPEPVLDFARGEDTALHSRFTWDDGEAAELYRLTEARQVLRVYVNIESPDSEPLRVRAFVSLPADRGREGYGYRPIKSVMGNEELRRQLFETAKKEMQSFRQKYRVLGELQHVFDAMATIID